jgi:NAD(P)-dependent dehydrogenase (short-subunit alcohol dehydrogenase family)
MSTSARPQALAGRGAVVTGGGRGIGAAVARALADAGAAVVVASRTPNQIERVADELLRRGAKAWAVACDVTDEASVARLGREARDRFGTVDVLVNNAGDSASAPLRKIALAEWQRMLSVNATGTFLCTRELLPAMVERGWGRVVNVASVAGLEGGKYIAHYAAAKHAVIGFTRSVALEVAGTGVTVDAVCPGYVDTPMTARNLDAIQARAGLGREQALAAVLATTGQERLVAPEEVAEAVVSLCAADAPRLSGRAIPLGFASVFELVNPGTLAAPRGYSHGVLAPRDGRLLFVAGQAGWDDGAPGEPAGCVEQFAVALDRALAVVREAGGGPTDIARLTVYVTDLAAGRAGRTARGEVWRARFGSYYPAMALVEVKGLADRGALVEIEATAVVPHR